MKTNLELSKEVVEKYKPILYAIRIRASMGDFDAAVQILYTLADESNELKKLGYSRENLELVERTPEWSLKQRQDHKWQVCDSMIKDNPEMKDEFEKMWKETELRIYGNNL